MSLTDIDKVRLLAKKAVEQVKGMDTQHAESFMVGLIYQVYREGEGHQAPRGTATFKLDQDVVNKGYKKKLH